jgi:Uma2 family endonuclease
MTDAPAQPWLPTGDDLLKMPEEMTKGYELIEGVLVPKGGTLSPTSGTHGKVENNAAFELTLFNRQHNLGTVITGDPGYYTRDDTHTVRAPDVAFVSYEKVPPDSEMEGFSRIPPDLVIEVVSPSNSAEEIEEKVQEWLAFGVKIVWVMFPKTRRVRVFTHDGKWRILNAKEMLDGGDVLPGFRVEVSALFK